MRLTKIKLAGFKSFVDSTVLHLPSNLVGIVGPNGCGKSNIIDAVRWVMGESSVRTLRGDSMADVIFSGSAARKPVGQAFVELSFDNGDGKLTGPWARYNEIAIKRLVERDGQSRYFLNGTRCRRRDIVDIFLGTGLGPRSYAIIEQDMISRIVEARPEDLRVFLEEAAGISRYKERRRETEHRIRHARENLDRLNDLREELGRRLQQLQRQAQAAERYQRYRAEERRLKAQLVGLRWRALDAEVKAQESEIRDRETGLDALLAEQRAAEARIEAERERQAALQETLGEVQGRHYATGSEIARLEQTLAHRRELRQRQREEQSRVESTLEQVLAQIRQDEIRIAEQEAALTDGEPALEMASAVEAEMDDRLIEAETAMQAWQAAWETFSTRVGEFQRAAEVERTRIEHLERQLLPNRRQAEKRREEESALAETRLSEELEALRGNQQEAALAEVSSQEALAELDARIASLRERQWDLSLRLNEAREHLQAVRGRLTSLETLQEAALGRHRQELRDWLRERQLDGAPRLLEEIQVETGWERAVETVLGVHLEAVCVEDLDGPASNLAESGQSGLCLFDTRTKGMEGPSPGDGALLGKIQAPWPLASLLAGVEMAADLNDALRRRAALDTGQSLVTPDGVWVGRDWLRTGCADEAESGVLVREQEMRGLYAVVEEGNRAVSRDAEALERMRIELQDLEGQRIRVQEEVNRRHREHIQLQSQADALCARAEQIRNRLSAISGELEELDRQALENETELQEARESLTRTLGALEQSAGEREDLTRRREVLQAALRDRRNEAARARQTVQQQALTLESLRTARDSARQALARLEAQRAQLEERRERLQAEHADEEEPALGERLEALLSIRADVEEDLAQARRAAQEQDEALRSLEKSRAGRERQAQTLRQALEARRLAWREVSVRRQTLQEQLREWGVDLDAVLAEMPAEAEESSWQEQLERLANRIQRLGPINLAAIDEFAQVSERKQYLDAQNEDLLEALNTLEDAIRRIDRETRSRFKETFERVDEGLRELFPRLFGGGQAHLELGGEDVLDSGVMIMARPPGKRIGTIHLLSGGEKALTAVALVFAIFKLNPAPFCMLDEVDAPLDEANVGRFGHLVREMSEQVQFVFITHNKGTMEIARHLSGVTMHEPGVSRLVAVDVDEAVRLAVA